MAVTSLLIANGVQQMVPYSSWLDLGNPVTPLQQEIQNSYNIKVSQLAFVVSLLYTGVGLLRLGWVVSAARPGLALEVLCLWSMAVMRWHRDDDDDDMM